MQNLSQFKTNKHKRLKFAKKDVTVSDKAKKIDANRSKARTKKGLIERRLTNLQRKLTHSTKNSNTHTSMLGLDPPKNKQVRI